GTEAGGGFSTRSGLALDSKNNVFIASYSINSSNSVPLKFPRPTGQTPYFDSGNNCETTSECYDALLGKFTNEMGLLEWGTFFGNDDGKDQAFDCSIDKQTDDFYVVGRGSEIPTKNKSGAYNSSTGLAFIAKFNKNFVLEWSTKIATSGINDQAKTIDIKSTRNDKRIIVGGISEGNGSLPIVDPGGLAFTSNHSGLTDGFIMNFNSSLDIEWSTYVGGGGEDVINDCVFDNVNNIILTGWTNSLDYTTSTSPLQGFYQGGVNSFKGLNSVESDVAITKFNSDFELQKSTYFGGSSNETGYDLAVDKENNFYTFITTSSDDGNIPFSQTKPTGFYEVQSLSEGHNTESDCFIAGFENTFFDDNFDLFWTTYFGGGGNHWVANGRDGSYGIHISNNNEL
ncbi:MAG: hypothetical protein ABEH43_07430, partial [Flavobacteriales bacterium]